MYWVFCVIFVLTSCPAVLVAHIVDLTCRSVWADYRGQYLGEKMSERIDHSSNRGTTPRDSPPRLCNVPRFLDIT